MFGTRVIEIGGNKMNIVLQQRQLQTQTMNLVMTAELRQAITLLQYSTYELYEFIREQELENPLIRLKEKFQEPTYNRTTNRGVSSASSYQNPIDYLANEEKGMHEQLLEQAKWLKINEKTAAILRYLILNLDENAYLSLNIDEAAEHLGVDNEKVYESLKLLQQLEPIGVGARNLQECLLLQVRHYYPEERLVEEVIEHHLDLLADKKWDELTKALNIPMTKIKDIYDLILTLEPKPSISMATNKTEYLEPDIVIEYEKGSYVVYLNDSYLPEIRFNNEYAGLLGQSSIQSYVKNHYRNYQWLLSSIEQRRSTILKVTQVIIRRQKEFFEKGFLALRPLTLKDVADEIEMHESTVSRATTNKVIQTPKGSFDLRIFFSTSVATENGPSLSQTKVKMLLKDIIENENKQKPFSDQKISDYFKKEKEITLSRRTVAKYRKELNILSSRLRKEINL